MDSAEPSNPAEHRSIGAPLLDGPLAEFQAYAGNRRSFSSRTMLLNEEEPRTYLLILEQGWAYAYRTLSDGRRHVVEVYVPGDVIGLAEAWTGMSGPGVATLTDVCAVSLTGRDLAAQFRRSPSAAAGLTTALAKEHEKLSCRTTSLARQTAYERVAYLMWCLCARTWPDERGKPNVFDCPVPQAVIADALGLSLVHVNRSLGQLARDGVLLKHTQTVEILDPDAFERIVRS